MMNLLCRILVMLIVIPFHEAAHAYVSWQLGDDTAKNMGRMTLDPRAHIDPLGALCMVVAGVGWAKPVPTAAWRFRDPKKGMALTALAGPASNLFLAFVSMMLYKVVTYAGIRFGGGIVFQFLITFLLYMVIMNVSLAVFNMLPVPPFDGSRIVLTFLPQRVYFKLMQYEKYIFVGMFLILMLGLLDGPLNLLNNYAVAVLDRSTRFVDHLMLFLIRM